MKHSTTQQLWRGMQVGHLKLQNNANLFWEKINTNGRTRSWQLWAVWVYGYCDEARWGDSVAAARQQAHASPSHTHADADRFYIALFSSCEQTHCAFVACDSKWVTVASSSSSFYSVFLNIQQSGVLVSSAIWLLHGWYYVRLLSSRRFLCTP